FDRAGRRHGLARLRLLHLHVTLAQILVGDVFVRPAHVQPRRQVQLVVETQVAGVRRLLARAVGDDRQTVFALAQAELWVVPFKQRDLVLENGRFALGVRLQVVVTARAFRVGRPADEGAAAAVIPVARGAGLDLRGDLRRVMLLPLVAHVALLAERVGRLA